MPSVTSRGVHCNAVQCRRRFSLLRRDLGPCGGVRRVGDVGPRRRALFDKENGGGGRYYRGIGIDPVKWKSRKFWQ